MLSQTGFPLPPHLSRKRPGQRISENLSRNCPAGQAPCAGSGHFVTCIPLRLALPLVASYLSLRPTGGPAAFVPPGAVVWSTFVC